MARETRDQRLVSEVGAIDSIVDTVGAAIGFGFAPTCGEPALLFHAVQGGKEGAGLDVESALGDLADAAGDAEAM